MCDWNKMLTVDKTSGYVRKSCTKFSYDDLVTCVPRDNPALCDILNEIC